MVRKIHRCSLCNTPGHNTRTCTKTGCLKLFGTDIYYEKHEDVQSMKAQRMGQETAGNFQDMNEFKLFGFDILGRKKGKQNRRQHEKPRIRWDEDEHKLFVAGLKWLEHGHENRSAKRSIFNKKFEDHDLIPPQGFPTSEGNNATTSSSKSPFPTPSSPATILKKIAPNFWEATSTITIAHELEEVTRIYQ